MCGPRSEELKYFLLSHTVQHDNKCCSPKPWPGRWRRATLHCTALNCNTALHSITLHYTALSCTSLHCMLLYYTSLYCSTLHFTALHGISLNYTALHCTTLHHTALHYTTLLCITLHCTALHCTALLLTVFFWPMRSLEEPHDWMFGLFSTPLHIWLHPNAQEWAKRNQRMTKSWNTCS